MRILHYFLGFPPYRTGGMTKFALDLMQTQVKDGNSVFALWPGKMNGAIPSIKKRKSVTGIKSYEIINPLPVPLDEGVRDFFEFTKPCNGEIFEYFLSELNVDVIHIHTLMGLHKEFVDAAQKLKIKLIFTSHDFYGLCPKVTLFRFGKYCDDDCDCQKCLACNLDALSIGKIQILQSPIYRKLKDTAVIKLAREFHRRAFFEKTEPVIDGPDNKNLAKMYKDLRSYYVAMLESVDVIHFNSTLAQQIYERYLTPKVGKVIFITHKDIKDCRDINHGDDEKLRIAYLSPHKAYKGYNVLESALDDIWKSGNHDFVLYLFHPVSKQKPYMSVQKTGYVYADLPKIFAGVDVLVAPSICYETFGFTALEAVSHGVPIIVSDNVGAKDVVQNAGIVVKAGSVGQLKEAILKLDRSKLDFYRGKTSALDLPLWVDVVKGLYELYL